MRTDKHFKKLGLTFAAVSGLSLAGCSNVLDEQALALNTHTPTEECSTTIQAHFNVAANTSVGDGHDVIVVPGFSTNNAYMRDLRDALALRGYTVHPWAGNFNSGASQVDADAFERQINDLYSQNGEQPISLVGYSLGGIYAREIARAYPEKIRMVITLSSPSNLQDDDGKTDETVQRVSDYYNRNANPADALDVPTSSFVSASDYIVDWRDALNTDETQAENIVVNYGHVTMPFSNMTHNIIAKRLTYSGESWQSLESIHCKMHKSRNGK